jgi:hypothetical protein
MQAPPSFSTEPSLAAQLLREWSDPLAYAHVDWHAQWPAACRQAHTRGGSAHRHLTRWVGTQLALSREPRVDLLPELRWLMAPAQQLVHWAEQAAAWLMAPCLAQVVQRAQLQRLRHWLGDAAFEAAWAALDGAPDDPLAERASPGLQWPPLTSTAMPAAPGAGAAWWRALGWVALNQCLDGPRASLAGRLRLVAGPAVSQPWPEAIDIDRSALRAMLHARSQA